MSTSFFCPTKAPERKCVSVGRSDNLHYVTDYVMLCRKKINGRRTIDRKWRRRGVIIRLNEIMSSMRESPCVKGQLCSHVIQVGLVEMVCLLFREHRHSPSIHFRPQRKSSRLANGSYSRFVLHIIHPGKSI